MTAQASGKPSFDLLISISAGLETKGHKTAGLLFKASIISGHISSGDQGVSVMEAPFGKLS